jgi:ADP-ribose pyrophosphatase
MAEPTAPQTVYAGKFLRVQEKDSWEYVERPGVSGVVAILPVTPDGKIILIEQFRVPVQRRVVELPAGLAGDRKGEEHEDLLAAAQRELREETGYTAPRWQRLLAGPSSAGLTNEMITFFLAVDAVRTSAPELDLNEKIEVHAIALPNLSSWLDEKQEFGCLVSYKIFAALHLAGKFLSLPS